ncbi:MAG: S8 family serine peptidase [Pseudomonadota bacterium]
MIKFWGCLVFVLGLEVSTCLAANMAPAHAARDAEASPSQVLVMLHLPPPHFRPDANYGGHYADDSGRSARRRVAEDLARKHGLKLLNDWPMATLGVDCYVMAVPPNESPAQMAERLSRDERVEWAQAMELFHGLQAGDPLYPVQPGGKDWHLAEIHQTTIGRNIRVAVVDSGVDDAHPDLQGQVQIRENFIDGNPYAAEMHGTGVAGIIAARGGNGMGIVGVAPGAKLMALRACWESPQQAAQCSSFTLGKALNFAIMHDAQVINLSLGGPPDRLLQRLLDAALSRGIAIIAAVDPRSQGGGFPASYPGVIAVSDEERRGAEPRVLVAPGRDIPTTVPGARWRFVSGSSYAAAHVTGMLALLLELRPADKAGLGWDKLAVNAKDAIQVDPAGIINVCATITHTTGKCLCLCPSTHASKANHNP